MGAKAAQPVIRRKILLSCAFSKPMGDSIVRSRVERPAGSFYRWVPGAVRISSQFENQIHDAVPFRMRQIKGPKAVDPESGGILALLIDRFDI
ncbi:hypothetical protein BH23CHL5_BH23CHL5_04140 [soil metagenome]